MTGPITHNIGIASAKAVQSVTPANPAVNNPQQPDSAAVSQASQDKAKENSQKLETADDKTSIQIPKRTEKVFEGEAPKSKQATTKNKHLEKDPTTQGQLDVKV